MVVTTSSQAFTRQFLVPLFVVISTTLVALFAIFFMMVSQQNNLALERERFQVEAALEDKSEFVLKNMRDYARWDEAVDNLAVKMNQNWANENIGPYLYNTQGYDHTFVIDTDGQTSYASSADKQTKLTAQSILEENFSPLLDRLNRVPIGTEERISIWILHKNKPTIVAASPIMPTIGSDYSKSYPRRYLIIIDEFSEAMLKDIGKSHNVTGLHFTAVENLKSPNLRGGRVEHAVATLKSSITSLPIIAICWDSEKPGDGILRTYLPWLIIVALNAIALSFVMLMRARHATRDLAVNEATARHLANHDTLTGLPNRRALMAHGARLSSESEPLAMLYLDLDGFKEVNDLFGHQAGDVLLTEATIRLQQQVGTSGMLARVGGDEFAIVMSGETCHQDATELAARIVEVLSAPFTASQINMVVSGSVGIALGRPNDSIDEMARLADIAMYAAKADGRNCWRLFENEMSEGREIRAVLEGELRTALQNRDIDVMFQPIVCADDNTICSLEALARWSSPTQGPVGPAVFVPIAEESGLIVALGEQVLRRACEAAVQWDVDLAVNLSPAQFWHESLVSDILKILDETGFPADRLELEITEGYLVSRPEKALRVINALRAHNIRIALDDFGTGFASIGYLRSFPIDRIKLDRSFVKTVHRDHDAAAVVYAVIALSKAMRLPMTAEGVENESQAILLKTAGCARLQGWAFGRPMSVDSVNATLGLKQRQIRRRA